MTDPPEHKRWVLLLRGINVGGKGRIAMAELRSCLSAAGLIGVRTYIQSGNVVCDASADLDARSVRTRAGDAIEAAFAFKPPLIALSAAQLELAVAANPYRAEGDENPKAVHYFFGAVVPAEADLAVIGELAAAGEAVAVVDGVVYLHAPDGIGRSKLAVALAKRLGSEATGRNHRSVLAIAELANSG